MQNTLSLFLIIAVLATSCHKTQQEPTAYINTFSANVNGVTFVPASIEVLFGGSSVPGARQVNIYAKNANGHEITLILLNYDGQIKTFTQTIGAYTIPPGGLYNSSYSTSGEIKISSIDKSSFKYGEVVTGTFQFGTDATVGTYSVTSGNFSVFVKQ